MDGETEGPRNAFIPTLKRRDFLCLAGAALVGEVPFILPSRSVAATPSLGEMAYQLSWVKNFQFIGEYIADYKGYYTALGLAVDLLAGGPSVAAEPIVVSGKALVGQSGPDSTANAVAKGAPLKIIGTNYQRASYAIIAMAEKNLREPRDMIGRKIGVQTKNLVIWRAFLKTCRIDPSLIDAVPVLHDFTPLISGEVDGFFGFSNDDAIQLKEKGYDVNYLLLADFGYKMFICTFMVTTDTLTNVFKRAQVVAFMKGEIKGWQDALKDPALGAKLTVEVYGKGNGLTETTQAKSAEATNALIVSPDTEKHGLFWMGDEAVDQTIQTLATAGVACSKDMFTNEILEECFQGKATL
jgi:ABC-type nitrate/sulfonate/bicarbonate transport system substrate-binding protein